MMIVILLSSISFAGCENKTSSPGTQATDTTAPEVSDTTTVTTVPETGEPSGVDTTLTVGDVVFGRWGLEIEQSGFTEYEDTLRRTNFEYLIGKSAPGEVYLTPELEAVMEDAGSKNVYAVHIIGVNADDKKTMDADEIKEIVKCGTVIEGFQSYSSVGEVFFLTADQINSLDCPDDKSFVCGMAVNGLTWNKNHDEFNASIDALAEGETLPVYVYFITASQNNTDIDDDLYTNKDRIGERVELYHNYVNSEYFGKLVSDGTIMKGLEDFVKTMGITADVIYTPHLNRLQTRMTAEQIKNLPEGYNVEIIEYLIAN